MKRKFFITGYPGSGKTTIFNDIVASLKKNLSKLTIYGFITKEIRIKGIRVGFSIENLRGEKGTLSHIDYKGGPRVGKYGVNLQDIEKVGINTLRDALKKPEAKIIAIDEIGKMELFHQEFLKILNKIIDSDKIMLATISYKMTELLVKFKNRRDTCIFNLENVPKDNMEREKLKEKILKIIFENFI